jgi:uncharacterized protein (DUF1684 family)
MPFVGKKDRTISRRAFAMAFVAALSAARVMPESRIAVAGAAYVKEVEAWRAKHEADYTKEYVPLAGLFFLKPNANSAGSASSNDIVLPKSAPASIGRFVYQNNTVRFEPRAGAPVKLRNQPLTSPVELRSDGGTAPPDELAVGGITLWVHESGKRRAIRMRDPHGDVARSFAGFRWLPIDERYRVTGRFIKDPAPHELSVPNQLGDEEVDTTEGVVEFALNGQTLRLRPMTTRPGRLWFTFRDGTSGHETYANARFLYADLRQNGTTVLDFNEAYNPPCAFNPYTTCPLPLPENRLKVPVLAGEKDYAHGQH